MINILKLVFELCPAIPNMVGDWAVKVEFVKNNSTMSYKERDSDGRE